jgi:hypothetical protein
VARDSRISVVRWLSFSPKSDLLWLAAWCCTATRPLAVFSSHVPSLRSSAGRQLRFRVEIPMPRPIRAERAPRNPSTARPVCIVLSGLSALEHAAMVSRPPHFTLQSLTETFTTIPSRRLLRVVTGSPDGVRQGCPKARDRRRRDEPALDYADATLSRAPREKARLLLSRSSSLWRPANSLRLRHLSVAFRSRGRSRLARLATVLPRDRPASRCDRRRVGYRESRSRPLSSR